MKRFTISGTFEADGIDDALAYLAEHFAEYADCKWCGLNDQTGAHERWCPVGDQQPARLCAITVEPLDLTLRSP